MAASAKVGAPSHATGLYASTAMRVIVTPLMDQGRPRLWRAAPVDAHLRSHRDVVGRLVYQLYYPDKDGTQELFGQHLINPQAGDVGKRTAVYYVSDQPWHLD